METEASNPYKTPEASVDTSQGGKLSGVFERFSAWGVFGLSLITLGIYPLYWLYTRTTQLNIHTREPISSGFVFSTLILYFMGLMGNIADALEWNVEITLALALAGMVGTIMFIVWAFKIRNRIHDLVGANNGDSKWFSAVLTFFLNSLYLQYKINCLIDEESA